MSKKSTKLSGRCFPVFSEEDSDLQSKTWRFNKDGYAVTTLWDKKTMVSLVTFAHHLVCLRKFGRRPNWSIRECTDHINRNRLDNRRCNLRIISMSESNLNRVPARTNERGISTAPGVTLHKKSNKWQALFEHKKKRYYLGLFCNRSLAIDAVIKKKMEL